jgi:hypothetical protein
MCAGSPNSSCAAEVPSASRRIHSRRAGALAAMLAVLALGALSSSAQAQAAEVTVEFSCSGIRYHYEGFPNAENNRITEKVTINGKAKYRHFRFNGPTGEDFYPLAVPPGHSSIDTLVRWNTNGVTGGRDIHDPGGITCERDPNFELEKLQRVGGGKVPYTKETLPSTHLGQTVEYVVVVRNTGNVALTPSLSDSGCEELSGGPTELQPEEQAAYKCHHVLTKADGEAGTYCNTASASGESLNRESNRVCVELPEKSEFSQKFGCKTVTIYWFGFPNEPGNTVFYHLRVDGSTFAQGNFTFNGPSGELPIEVNLGPGHHSEDVLSHWNTNGVKGGGDHKLAGGITCTGE